MGADLPEFLTTTEVSGYDAVGAGLPEFLTTTEVSGAIRTPVETLRYWRGRGEGPRSFRLGRRVLYARSDVLAWINERRAATSR